MNLIKIENKLFKANVYFISNCTPDECRSFLKKKNNKYSLEPSFGSNMAGTIIRANNGLYRIIYMPKFNLGQESRGTLIHELFHLVVRLSEDKGLPIVSNIQTGQVGDETSAYMIEYYYNEIVEQFKKATARKGKGENARTYVKSKARKRSGDYS